MSDDTPTVRFDQPAPSGASGASGDGGDKAKKSRTLIIILSVVGGLLLIAIVILLTLLLSRGAGNLASVPVVGPGVSASPSGSPSASPSASPSETPSASPSSTPSSPPSTPPQATGPRFTKLNFPSSQRCSAAAPGFPATRPTFTVSWSTAGAVEAWFINGTDDAADSKYLQIPLSGNQGDFPPGYEQTVDCSDGSNTYTITLVGPDGKHVSKTWNVTITGDHF